jgi:hypothetical protein
VFDFEICSFGFGIRVFDFFMGLFGF